MLCSATKRASNFLTEQLQYYVPDDQLEAMLKQPYMLTAGTVMVRRSLGAKRLYSLLKKHEPNIRFPNSPFATFNGDDLLSVRIYPNIKGDWHEGLDCVTWPVSDKFISPMWEQLKDDLGNPHKAKRWEVASRSIKIALKREVISLQKFLTNFSNLKTELGWRDDQIRSLAERMDTRVHLVLCKDDMDFTEYLKTKTGGCVEYISNHHGQAIHDKWRAMGDKGQYPSLFLKYSPELQAVFIKSNGEVRARALLCKKTDNKLGWGEYFYVRAQGQYAKQLTDELESYGVKKRGDYDYFSFSEKFNVPAVDYYGVKAMPLPHLDEVKKDFGVTFNPDTAEFTVWPNCSRGTPIHSTYAHNGYVHATKVKEYKE